MLPVGQETQIRVEHNLIITDKISSFLTRQKTQDNYGRTGPDSKRLESQECIHITTVTDKTQTDLSLGAKD